MSASISVVDFIEKAFGSGTEIADGKRERTWFEAKRMARQDGGNAFDFREASIERDHPDCRMPLGCGLSVF